MDFRSISSFVNSPGSDGLRMTPSPNVELTSGSVPAPTKIGTKPICEGCRKVIHDRWLLQVGDDMFHMSCLRCCMCLRTLDNQASCFVRDDQVYCRGHYQSRFCPRCSGCDEILHPSDWVRKARDLVYHLDCFCCSKCKRKLSTGDTCAVKSDSIECSEHCDVGPNSAQDDDAASVSSVDSDCRGSESEERFAGGKRPRTTFTQAQTRILHEHFRRNQNPSPEDMERIADLTGHPRKTVMIWFQNARARNKKLLLSGGLSSSNQTKKSGTCHWIANPCSPGTIPFSE